MENILAIEVAGHWMANRFDDFKSDYY